MYELVQFTGPNGLHKVFVRPEHVAMLERVGNSNETPHHTQIHFVDGRQITVVGEAEEVALAMGFSINVTQLEARPRNGHIIQGRGSY